MWFWLQHASVEEMFQPRFVDDNGFVGVFWHDEFGDDIHPPRQHLVGHTGGDPGVFAFLYLDPETQTGILIVSSADANMAMNGTMDALGDLMEQLFYHADEVLAQPNGKDDEGDDMSSGSLRVGLHHLLLWAVAISGTIALFAVSV